MQKCGNMVWHDFCMKWAAEFKRLRQKRPGAEMHTSSARKNCTAKAAGDMGGEQQRTCSEDWRTS